MLTAFREREVRVVIVVALAAEALTLAYGAIVATMLGEFDPRSPAGVVRLWRNWDADIPLAIAEHGYQATPGSRTLDFFPLIPAMINGLSRLRIDPLVSTFLIVTVFGVVAAAALYRLATLDDPRTARTVALGLLLFPNELRAAHSRIRRASSSPLSCQRSMPHVAITGSPPGCAPA